MKLKHILTLVWVTSALISCTSQPEWKAAGEKIMTPWGEALNPMNVHQEYPRPQLVRGEWLNLNGLWEYAITDIEAEPLEYEGHILVPFAVESALSGVGRSLEENQALWYEREFVVPRAWKGRRMMLNFGAVDWKAEVFVDGRKVGEHSGGYAPFSMDVTDFLAKDRKHELKLKVTDRTEKWFQARGKQATTQKGIWYTPVSGIWQTVWMEPVAESYVNSYLAESDIDKGVLNMKVDAELAEGDVCEIVLIADGEPVAAAEGTEAVLDVPDMRLWSPSDPYLYELEIRIFRDGKLLDEVKGYTAMRKISYARGADGHNRMLLNNEPLFHFGTLDQGWWPDGLYTAPSDEALVFDIVKTKEMGFNMIRKHVKVEPARWYWHCDRLGILVWQDMPSISDTHNEVCKGKPVTEEGKANFYKEWGEIMKANMGFPCIVVWVPFNEAWGQFDTEAVTQFTRSIDSSRLIDYASGGYFIEGSSADILDMHNYPAPWMHTYDRNSVNVLGEYGGVGLPVMGHLWQPDRNWGYVQYKNAGEVLDVYEKYADQLIDLIDKGFAAAVYTQITDVEGEVNGLMTYDRKVVKLDVERLNAINTKVIASM